MRRLPQRPFPIGAGHRDPDAVGRGRRRRGRRAGPASAADVWRRLVARTAGHGSGDARADAPGLFSRRRLPMLRSPHGSATGPLRQRRGSRARLPDDGSPRHPLRGLDGSFRAARCAGAGARVHVFRWTGLLDGFQPGRLGAGQCAVPASGWDRDAPARELEGRDASALQRARRRVRIRPHLRRCVLRAVRRRERFLFVPVINTDFVIPAGAADQEVRASIPFIPFGVHVYSITPHMHLLGRKMTVRATMADGSSRCLVDVPDWDFHWQRTYEFRDRSRCPSGAASI